MAGPKPLQRGPAPAGPQVLADGRSRVPLAGLALAAAGFAAYAGSLQGQFLHDDLGSIGENRSIRSLATAFSPPHGYGWTVDGRPLLNASLALNYAVSGLDVWSYHLLNLLIHVAAALALFGIVRRTLERQCSRLREKPDRFLTKPATGSAPTAVAFAAALVWAVHPLLTEAVSYVIQRAESLTALCCLLTLYCFVRYAEMPSSAQPSGATEGKKAGRGMWASLSFLACLFGMATKETMVVTPMLVFAYDAAFVAGSAGLALARRRRYYLGLAATWLLLALLVLNSGGNRSGSKGFGIGVPWGRWILTQFEALVRYLRLSAWPHPLIFNYGPYWRTPAQAAPYAIVVALAAAATLWGLRPLLRGGAGVGRRAAGFAGLCFFAVLSVTSLVPGNGDMIAERRMYLPLAALVGTGVPAFCAWAGRRGLAACLFLALALGALTWRRNLDYRTDVALWTDTIAKRPGNPYALYNLGVAYYNRGRISEEMALYRRALAADPHNAEAEHSLASELFRQGQVAEAARYFQGALADRPAEASIHYDYGVLLFQQGDLAGAEAEYRQALSFQPEDAQAHDNLGILMARDGRAPAAEAEFRKAIEFDPALMRAHVNLAGLLAGQDRLDEAADEYRRALGLEPGFAPAHFYLGNVLMGQGRFAEAAAQYREVLRLDPANSDARHNLDEALAAGRGP